MSEEIQSGLIQDVQDLGPALFAADNTGDGKTGDSYPHTGDGTSKGTGDADGTDSTSDADGTDNTGDGTDGTGDADVTDSTGDGTGDSDGTDSTGDSDGTDKA